MRHKYLEEIKAEDAYTWDTKGDPREERWKKQRNIYGFDDRETWNLNSTFYAWLYEHLRMYEDIGGEVINLDFYKFEYDGKIYTQKEMIDQICEIIEYYFSNKFDDWNEDDCEYVSNIGKMWAIILPAMWW